MRRERDASRRAFLQQGSLLMVAAGVSPAAALAAAEEKPPLVRIGLLTDLHYADKPPAGSRHYRDTLAKVAEAARRFHREKTDLVVELGDFVDAADSVDTELEYLAKIDREYSACPGEKHYVLGNHCVDTLTKQEFLRTVGQDASYYSFDFGGYHFVILDACFRSDGVAYGRRNFQWTDPNIPQKQLAWLREDLAETTKSTIVFVHQRLDVSNQYGVKNAEAVRAIFRTAGNVVAVFQGHSHRNDYHRIERVHYCTLAAMVEGAGEENNAYAAMDIFDGGTIRVRGFRKQENYRWDR
jgi:3',5'-cyclic AMP phosphodiesterase CpdA